MGKLLERYFNLCRFSDIMHRKLTANGIRFEIFRNILFAKRHAVNGISAVTYCIERKRSALFNVHHVALYTSARARHHRNGDESISERSFCLLCGERAERIISELHLANSVIQADVNAAAERRNILRSQIVSVCKKEEIRTVFDEFKSQRSRCGSNAVCETSALMRIGKNIVAFIEII